MENFGLLDKRKYTQSQLLDAFNKMKTSNKDDNFYKIQSSYTRDDVIITQEIDLNIPIKTCNLKEPINN